MELVLSILEVQLSTGELADILKLPSTKAKEETQECLS